MLLNEQETYRGPSAAGVLHAGQHRRSLSRGHLQCQASQQANMHIGSLVSNGLRFGVVVARFNELVTKPLLEGVLEGLERHGTARSEVQVGDMSNIIPASETSQQHRKGSC